jgi:hypothetical protein
MDEIVTAALNLRYVRRTRQQIIKATDKEYDPTVWNAFNADKEDGQTVLNAVKAARLYG